MITGYDPRTLREIVDVRAAQARLLELGNSRSTAAIAEKADLFRLLGRLDEALAAAEQAFRLSYFGGDRQEKTRARLRRAQVFQFQGGLQHALAEMVASRGTAGTEGWDELEAFAAHNCGIVLVELGRIEEARAAFADALAVRTKIGSPADEVNASRFALEALESPGLTGPVS